VKSLYHLEGSEMQSIHAIARLDRDHLLRRPWFSQVWVFQELVLSKDPWIQ
jgi:hypothetical protein